MAGREPEAKRNLEEESVMDAVLSLWQNKGDILTFQQIHDLLVQKGVVQKTNYRYKTVRLLTLLERRGVVRKIDRGRYQIQIDPSQFRLFDTLKKIEREKGMTRLRGGGALWTGAEFFLLGFPEEGLKYNYVKFPLMILVPRLTRIFQALEGLCNIVRIKGQNGQLPDQLLRELILELPSHILGERAGVDGDGLPTHQLIEVMRSIINSIPEKIEDKENPGWSDSTYKEEMLELFKAIEEMRSQMIVENGPEGEGEWEENGKFAVVITPPEWIIDESGWERREIVATIKDYAEWDPLYIAYWLVPYDANMVLSALQVEGVATLGKEKALAVEDFFMKHVASKELVYCLPSVTWPSPNKQFIRVAKKKAKEYAHKYGAKEIISLFPFHSRRVNKSTAHEVKLLFPEIPSEEIEMWLSEGEEKVKKLHENFKEVVKKLKNSEVQI